jgi:hypothetical protein
VQKSETKTMAFFDSFNNEYRYDDLGNISFQKELLASFLLQSNDIAHVVVPKYTTDVDDDSNDVAFEYHADRKGRWFYLFDWLAKRKTELSIDFIRSFAFQLTFAISQLHARFGMQLCIIDTSTIMVIEATGAETLKYAVGTKNQSFFTVPIEWGHLHVRLVRFTSFRVDIGNGTFPQSPPNEVGAPFAPEAVFTASGETSVEADAFSLGRLLLGMAVHGRWGNSKRLFKNIVTMRDDATATRLRPNATPEEQDILSAKFGQMKEMRMLLTAVFGTGVNIRKERDYDVPDEYFQALGIVKDRFDGLNDALAKRNEPELTAFIWNLLAPEPGQRAAFGAFPPDEGPYYLLTAALFHPFFETFQKEGRREVIDQRFTGVFLPPLQFGDDPSALYPEAQTVRRAFGYEKDRIDNLRKAPADTFVPQLQRTKQEKKARQGIPAERLALMKTMVEELVEQMQLDHFFKEAEFDDDLRKLRAVENAASVPMTGDDLTGFIGADKRYISYAVAAAKALVNLQLHLGDGNVASSVLNPLDDPKRLQTMHNGRLVFNWMNANTKALRKKLGIIGDFQLRYADVALPSDDAFLKLKLGGSAQWLLTNVFRKHETISKNDLDRVLRLLNITNPDSAFLKAFANINVWYLWEILMGDRITSFIPQQNTQIRTRIAQYVNSGMVAPLIALVPPSRVVVGGDDDDAPDIAANSAIAQLESIGTILKGYIGLGPAIQHIVVMEDWLRRSAPMIQDLTRENPTVLAQYTTESKGLPWQTFHAVKFNNVVFPVVGIDQLDDGQWQFSVAGKQITDESIKDFKALLFMQLVLAAKIISNDPDDVLAILGAGPVEDMHMRTIDYVDRRIADARQGLAQLQSMLQTIETRVPFCTKQGTSVVYDAELVETALLDPVRSYFRTLDPSVQLQLEHMGLHYDRVLERVAPEYQTRYLHCVSNVLHDNAEECIERCRSEWPFDTLSQRHAPGATFDI